MMHSDCCGPVRRNRAVTRALPLVAFSLASCSFTERVKQEPVPHTLHLVSRGAHYVLPGELVSEVQQAGFKMAGVAFEKGLQRWTQPPGMPCGTSSNIGGNGSPWVFYFRKPQGPKGDRQVVALGVDRMETYTTSDNGGDEIGAYRKDWKPRLSKPTGTDNLCDVIVLPKDEGSRTQWSGGTMLCGWDDGRGRECYVEIPRHGTLWSTEFLLKKGETPDDRIAYAVRFIDSIHVEDDVHAPRPFIPLDRDHPQDKRSILEIVSRELPVGEGVVKTVVDVDDDPRLEIGRLGRLAVTIRVNMADQYRIHFHPVCGRPDRDMDARIVGLSSLITPQIAMRTSPACG